MVIGLSTSVLKSAHLCMCTRCHVFTVMVVCAQDVIPHSLFLVLYIFQFLDCILINIPARK